VTERPAGASPVDAISPGTRLREWEVLRFLGRGSYGVVFEARRSSWLNEPSRALKVFDPIVSLAARQALLGEFSALTALRHPHLLAGIDAFDIDEPPFAGCVVFVLELAEEDLANRVAAAGPLRTPQLAVIGAHVASGLATLHHQGRVHGDVKPENILRVGDRWVLGDFGVTGLLEGSYAFTPGTTIDYRPPELADSSDGNRLHRSADVWGLGVTLHVAATGRHPFRGPDPMMRYASVLRGDRAPSPAALDPRLSGIIDRECLVPDPRQRVDAVGLEARLRALAAEPSAGLRQPGEPDRIPPDPDRPPGHDSGSEGLRSPERVPPAPPMPAMPIQRAVGADPSVPAPSTRGALPPPPATAGRRGRRALGQPPFDRRYAVAAAAVVISLVIAQLVALGAGALDASLGARRSVYVIVSLGALLAVAALFTRRWPHSRDLWMWAGAAAATTWAVATALLFGAFG
jgi:serine/threonine protein kinase